MESTFKFKLVTTENYSKEFSQKELEQINIIIDDVLIYKSKKSIEGLIQEKCLLIYLPDALTKSLISSIINQEHKLIFLPHPDAPALKHGFGIEQNVSEILNAIQEKKIEEKKIDIITCNEETVLHQVSFGSIIPFITSKKQNNILQIIKSSFKFLKNIRTINASLATFNFDDHSLETAFTDILIVQQTNKAILSRYIIDDSHYNDGLFHCFIFAPRSVFQLVYEYLQKIIKRDKQAYKKTKFIGHIKTDKLSIKFTQNKKIVIDGKSIETNEFTTQFLGTINRLFTKTENKNEEAKEESSVSSKINETNMLPQGDIKRSMISKSIPWIGFASNDEFKDLFIQLRENAKPKTTYIVLMILSTLLATLGLFSNSSPVIIGAMILAPLMSPIISLSMGTLRQDRKLITSSIFTISVGIGVGFICAVLLTWITPINQNNSEILLRTNPNLIDLGIAIISGIAGAYAHSKEEIAKTLAGVAIAVALVPPLAVTGIGFALMNWSIFIGAFLLLLTNLTGMVLAGAFTFLLGGFSPLKLAKKGIIISSIIVLLLSLPLSYGFYKIVQENNIINSLTNENINDIEIKNVVITTHKPLTLSITISSTKKLTSEDIQQIKMFIEKRLNKEEIILEISTLIKI